MHRISYKVHDVKNISGLRMKNQSVHWDFSYGKNGGYPGGTRILDFTTKKEEDGTYSVLVAIVCDTEEACRKEFSGQLSDGFFENFSHGEIEELTSCEL